MRVVVLVCLLAAACTSSSPSAPTTPLNVQVTVAAGQTVDVTPGLRLRFQGVTGDSRCPGDALCIQGGDAIVRIDVESTTGGATYELHTGDMKPVRYAELTVALVELTPYPFSSRPPIAPGDYRATFRVTR